MCELKIIQIKLKLILKNSQKCLKCNCLEFIIYHQLYFLYSILYSFNILFNILIFPFFT